MVRKSILIALCLFASLGLVYPVLGGNLGHRAGGDHFQNLPENSLAVLKQSLVGGAYGAPIQFDIGFQYLEFDVQETADGVLVVFHDDNIARMLPLESNQKAYESILNDDDVKSRIKRKKLKPKHIGIEHLSFYQLNTLFLRGEGKQKVPSLFDFLYSAMEWKVRRPVVVEIKKILTEAGRAELVRTVSWFHHTYLKHQLLLISSKFKIKGKTSFLSYRKNFKKSFYPKSKKEKHHWCREIKNEGLVGVHLPWVHKNMCD